MTTASRRPASDASRSRTMPIFHLLHFERHAYAKITAGFALRCAVSMISIRRIATMIAKVASPTGLRHAALPGMARDGSRHLLFKITGDLIIFGAVYTMASCSIHYAASAYLALDARR